MNREIKFRAYDNKTNKVYEVENIYIQDEYLSLVVGEFNEGNTIKRRISEVELIQYTGLKDKNGKKIYEGDIVKNYWSMNNEVVKYMGVTFMTENMYEESAVVNLEECEVIGNIYENPELCEKK